MLLAIRTLATISHPSYDTYPSYDQDHYSLSASLPIPPTIRIITSSSNFQLSVHHQRLLCVVATTVHAANGDQQLCVHHPHFAHERRRSHIIINTLARVRTMTPSVRYEYFTIVTLRYSLSLHSCDRRSVYRYAQQYINPLEKLQSNHRSPVQTVVVPYIFVSLIYIHTDIHTRSATSIVVSCHYDLVLVILLLFACISSNNTGSMQ